MPRQFFFISDLHIGGDGELRNCDFEEELIEFLRSLEEQEDAELIINGDAFGLWEFTTLKGMEKLEALIEQQPRVFEQFRETGSRVRITLMPGNHDYELACFPAFIERLKEFNLDLVPEVSITRELAGKKIWIEHGMQHDERNYMPEFGNPFAQPIGYFITAGIVGTAGRYSEFGRGNWLKDVQAVMPVTEIPTWTISNYFYREMGPLLRWTLLPLLFLVGVGALVVLSWLAEALGFLPVNPVLDNPLTDSLGTPGRVLRDILIIDAVLIVVVLIALLPIMIPLGIIFRDVLRTLGRYNILLPKSPAQIGDGPYLEAAERVFERDSSVAVFVYGHTHLASLTEVDGRFVINTGTWLKMPRKLPVLFGLLPPVYHPSFNLNFFKLAEEDGRLTIVYERIEKEPPSELTLVQRMLSLTRRPRTRMEIPNRTVVDP